MAHVTVRLQVSDCNLTDQLEQNTAVYSAITVKEIVIAMINRVIGPFFCLFFVFFPRQNGLHFMTQAFLWKPELKFTFMVKFFTVNILYH